MKESGEPETGANEDSGAVQLPENALNNESTEASADPNLDDHNAPAEITHNDETEVESASKDQGDQEGLEHEEQDFIPDWLRPEFSGEGEEPQKAGKESEPHISEMEIEHLRDDTGEEALTESEAGRQESAEPDRDLGELGWLEQIASGAGASLDETPTMSWDDQPEEEGSSDNDEDEMTWLDEIETEESMPIISELEDSYLDHESSGEKPTDAQITDVETPSADSVGELPEDPDEVMAWLENLAARQGADPEELPSYSGDLTEPGQASMDQIPEDPDEAMAWLEQLSALEDSQPDDSILEAELPLEIESDEFAPHPPESEPSDDEPGVDEVEMSEDLSEALMWLEEIVEIPAEKPAAEVQLEEQVEEYVPEKTIEAEEEIISDTIDDEEVEEAMEWLEQLAARQGAAPEELTSVVEADADVSTPDWLEAQQIDSQLEETAIEEFEGDTTLIVSDIEEPIEDAELVATEWEHTESNEEENVEHVSEVTAGISDEPATEEDIAWLETLGSVDAEGWLDSEAEAVEITEDSQISQIDSGILLSEELAVESGPEIQEEIDQLAEIDVEPMDSELLEAAHSAIKSGDFMRAAEEYAILLEQDIDLNQLILDIETTSESFSQEPLLQRLLGDAYRKNGQSQEALEVYRKALDNL